jgi:hypothetical protein
VTTPPELKYDPDIIADHDNGMSSQTWLLALVGAVVAVLLAVDIGTRWAEAGARIEKRCEGDAGVYLGSIRGDGVLAINPYDRDCLRPPPPELPGDSRSSSNDR